jgi:hypothetical protein
MILIKYTEEKRVHHRFLINDKPYYRNEEFYLKEGIWVSETNPEKLWAVGDQNGNGPFGCPENWKQLEREFKLIELGI